MPAVAAALEGLEPEQTQHLHQRISMGGDKYRLTLITFAVIQKWFQHDQSPVGVLPQYILLVPCSRHVRLEDVSSSGTLLQDVMPRHNNTRLQTRWSTVRFINRGGLFT